MVRYHFLADFESPERGPALSLVPPFDKYEVVQGSSVYPPSPETQVIVAVECQEHTRGREALLEAERAFAEAGAADPAALDGLRNEISALETAMRAAALALSESYEYLGVEEYA